MNSMLGLCTKDISFASFGEILIWIGTGVLIILAILALIKKPK